MELVHDRKSILINNEIFKYFPVEKFNPITSKDFDELMNAFLNKY